MIYIIINYKFIRNNVFERIILQNINTKYHFSILKIKEKILSKHPKIKEYLNYKK
jgi:hypothetical protein